MLSKTPIGLGKIKTQDLDRQILRLGIIAELDAIKKKKLTEENSKPDY